MGFHFITSWLLCCFILSPFLNENLLGKIVYHMSVFCQALTVYRVFHNVTNIYYTKTGRHVFT